MGAAERGHPPVHRQRHLPPTKEGPGSAFDRSAEWEEFRCLTYRLLYQRDGHGGNPFASADRSQSLVGGCFYADA